MSIHLLSTCFLCCCCFGWLHQLGFNVFLFLTIHEHASAINNFSNPKWWQIGQWFYRYESQRFCWAFCFCFWIRLREISCFFYVCHLTVFHWSCAPPSITESNYYWKFTKVIKPTRVAWDGDTSISILTIRDESEPLLILSFTTKNT